MLLSKLKEIRNGRMIAKDAKSEEFVEDYKGFKIYRDMGRQFPVLIAYNSKGYNMERNGVTASTLNQLKSDIDSYVRSSTDSKTNKVEIVETNGLWEVRMDGKLVVSATTKEGAIKEAKKFGLMDWNDSKTKDVSYEVIWKEKQGGSEQRRVFPSKEEADRFVAHKERVDSRSYGVIVLKTLDSKMKDDFTVPLTVEEIKSLFVRIDPAYAKMLSGVVTSKKMAVQRGLEKGLKLSPKGIQFKDADWPDQMNYSGFLLKKNSRGSVDIIWKGQTIETFSDMSKAKDYVEENLETLRDHGYGDSKDSYDPTKPKNIAAAKKLSVAQGKAATGDKKVKDGETVAQFKGFNIEKLNNGQFQAVDYGYISSPLRLKPPQSSIEEVKKQINDYLK